MHALSLVGAFRCLGAECEDTCCQGWAMQVEPRTEQRYREAAPEILADVVGEPGLRAMRRDPETDFCVRFEGGLCGIQKKHGEDYLGDACYFYPRILRRAGEATLLSASLSCPEIARLALSGEGRLAYEETPLPARLPQEMKTYASESLDEEGMLRVHDSCLAWAQEKTAEEALLDLAALSQHWEKEGYAPVDAVSALTARAALPAAQALEVDAYRLAHCLGVTILASRRKAPPRLARIRDEWLAALQAAINPENFMIENRASDFSAARRLSQAWNAAAPAMKPVMRRWLAMQISATFFPFGGLGATPYERAVMLAVKYATFRAGLAAALSAGASPSAAEAARVAQGLSRFLDHLADPALSLALYRDAGWMELSRLRGLLSSA